MRVIMVPFGSHGDVHPLMGLGHELQSRGHRVTFIQPEYFVPLLHDAGFEVETYGGPGNFEASMDDPNLWHPSKAFQLVVARLINMGVRPVFEAIARLYVPGETVVVAGTIAFGARMAEEKLGVPTVSIHLQPGVIHSNFETPIYAGLETRRWPRWFKQRFFDLIYAKMIDPHILPELNASRAELGLPPVRDPMRSWLHGASLVLGFFPEWFGQPQPDWPKNLQLVGFPLYDEHDVTPISPELLAFLDEGPAPIAFTPGTANVFGRPFFEAAVDGCVRMKRRGILLTRFSEQVPANLPPEIRHFAYAPFSQLLPRVAALVHHGGIGTASQGMAAGVPQLVMPLAHDQFDNAARMTKLGIGRSLVPKKFTGSALAKQLCGWIDSSEVLAACRAVKERIADERDSLMKAAVAIEQMVQRTNIKAN